MPTHGRDARAIAERFRGDHYVAYHAPRYVRVLQLLADLPVGPGTAVLDIGRSALTDLIAERFGATVDSLDPREERDTATGHHYSFDLNDTASPARWRADLPRYDVIVFCEVVEHLYTSPRHVLRYLASRLVPGGTLLLQTPNALALPKRLKLLVGIHPFEPIHEDRRDPGHFREYTRAELVGHVRATGLRPVHAEVRNVLDFRYKSRWSGDLHRHEAPRWDSIAQHAVYRVMYRLLPRDLRPLITVIARRD